MPPQTHNEDPTDADGTEGVTRPPSQPDVPTDSSHGTGPDHSHNSGASQGRQSSLDRARIERLAQNAALVYREYLGLLDDPKYESVKNRRKAMKDNDSIALGIEDLAWSSTFAGETDKNLADNADWMTMMSQRLPELRSSFLQSASRVSRAALLLRSGQISLQGFQDFCDESRTGNAFSTLQPGDSRFTPEEGASFRLRREMQQNDGAQPSAAPGSSGPPATTHPTSGVSNPE
ncbi:hypothetical protein IAT40_000984 [Kwoniella sp. CBS 6097]